MNSICAHCQNKGTFIHECSIKYCSIIYPTGLRDERKTALRQGVSCSINCVLPAGKSVIKISPVNVIFELIIQKKFYSQRRLVGLIHMHKKEFEIGSHL